MNAQKGGIERCFKVNLRAFPATPKRQPEANHATLDSRSEQ
ncbi:hypothetical protein A28LD_1317 [Idiomarina sp. A28L]|nr:hypothetical protein A28LD_1317 [Idiomarina sp. A28L]